MTEQQLISKIRELRQIKPRQDWVIFTKNRIFNAETETRVSVGFSFVGFLRELQRGERFVFQHKPAFAVILVCFILIGVFGFTQNSVPGDSLFTLKKITEKSQEVFVSGKDQLKYNFELANRRLDDLTKVAQTNQAQKLAPAINEFQESITKAVESLTKADSQGVKEIAQEIKKLEEKTEKVKSLGIEIENNQELENALARIVEREIADLEGRTLTEEQQKILVEVKDDYQAKDYSQALEKILILTSR